MSETLDRHDQVTHFWCPQLGQPLHFGYCRQVNAGLPCPRVVACFACHFPVEEFLEAHYTPEERQRFLAPAKGRLERVAEALTQSSQDKPSGEDQS